MRPSSRFRIILFVVAPILIPSVIFSQSITQKQVNQQTQFWTSINSNFRLNEKWGMLADFHIRRNNFVEDPSFTIIRGAANYYLKDNTTLALGYGHMWLAPSRTDWHTLADENRIYQQFQVSSKSGRNTLVQRIRNEQRWVDKIENDQKTGATRFTNRLRYLVSYAIPLSQNKKAISAVLADEIALQVGKEIVYNTFEQNRIFLGIKQSISPKLSYDFGYMNVYQQKISGYQYDMNHTIRLFFYYNSGWERGKDHAKHPSNLGQDHY